MTIPHGTILGGLSTVPRLEKAIAAYRDTLGFTLIEQGELPESLAAAWNCPASAGAPYAMLQPASGAPCFFRLVQQPDVAGFKPTTTYGWAAFECTVQDVWHWPDALPADQFEVVGPPKPLAGPEPTFIPMQVFGPGREMLYLNEVLDTPGNPLPMAQSPVDKIFICVLATSDRLATQQWYCDKLALDKAEDWTIPYSMINKAFGLPADHLTTLSMVNAGDMTVVEVDDYPAQTTARHCHSGMLPPGNALVTLAVRNLDACTVEWITPPAARDGRLYEGRRTGTTLGPAGELLELVEVGA